MIRDGHRSFFSVAGDEEKEPVSYTEKNYCVNDYSDGFGGKRARGRLEEEQKMEQELEQDEIGWDNMESLLEGQQEAKVEVKQEVDWEQEESFEQEPLAKQRKPNAVKQVQRVKVTMGREDEDDNLEEAGIKFVEQRGDFQCKLCGKSFQRLMILINHCRREHPDNPEVWSSSSSSYSSYSS